MSVLMPGMYVGTVRAQFPSLCSCHAAPSSISTSASCQAVLSFYRPRHAPSSQSVSYLKLRGNGGHSGVHGSRHSMPADFRHLRSRRRPDVSVSASVLGGGRGKESEDGGPEGEGRTQRGSNASSSQGSGAGAVALSMDGQPGGQEKLRGDASGATTSDGDGGDQAGADSEGTAAVAGESGTGQPGEGEGQSGSGWLSSNPVVRFFSELPMWQQKRKLEKLEAAADANPTDASKQTAYLTALLQASNGPRLVIERFERREHATDAAVVAAYLRALVMTGQLDEYLPDEKSGRVAGLPILLGELKQRATGDAEDAPVVAGLTEQQPLHVLMVDPKAQSRGMRMFQDILNTILIVFFFSVMWALGEAALRRYVSGVAGMSPGGPAGMGTGSVYSPKEYSKETLPEKNVKTFKDVRGCDEAKAELEEIVEYLKSPAKFTRLGGKLPKGVLLVGPPGTGKTLLAKAIAGEAGVPFFYRAGSEFEEMFVGVGARRVRSLFQAAKKKAPCIVFIDEIDAIGGSRKQWEGHTKKTLNQLLVEMDGFEANEGIIVLAATNLPETLDPALTRPGRFDRHVVVPNPDVKGRQEILELYLGDKPMAEDVDIKTLARGTPGFSGADLANLVNMAAVKAAVDNTEKITVEQLEFARDKLLMGAERKSMALTEEGRKLTAYHESGHAVVAFNTGGAAPIHKATITPRGNALGMVTQLPDKDETSVSRRQMLAKLDVCMGGRVAEEMVFGPEHVTTGARSDLQQATAIARHMVSECGMSDVLGPVYLEADNRVSVDMQKSVDAEITRLLKEAYERVRHLLKKHEGDLHKLATALLEYETLTAKDIQNILRPLQKLPEGADGTPAGAVVEVEMQA